MKKLIFTAAIAAFMAAVPQDSNIRKTEDGATVITTKVIGKKITGYQGRTPVEVYLRNGKIEKIVPLENFETEAYLRVPRMCLRLWSAKLQGSERS